mgnify:CR=1 FL=1
MLRKDPGYEPITNAIAAANPVTIDIQVYYGEVNFASFRVNEGEDSAAVLEAIRRDFHGHGRLELLPSGTPAPDGAVELPFTTAADHIFVEGALGARDADVPGLDRLTLGELRVRAETRYDQILLDSPPALVSDMAIIGRLVDGVLEINDVILGVGGGPFDADARKSFARAIQQAETKAAGGVMRMTVWRAGKAGPDGAPLEAGDGGHVGGGAEDEDLPGRVDLAPVDRPTTDGGYREWTAGIRHRAAS